MRVKNTREETSWKRKITQDESSLDRRLMEAKEAAAQLEKLFAENNMKHEKRVVSTGPSK